MEKKKRTQSPPMMRRDITYISGVQMEEAVEITRHCFFRDEEMEAREKIIRCPEDFSRIYQEWIQYWNFERCVAEMHEQTGREAFYYYGKCSVCNTVQPMVVDYRFAEEENGRKKPNWRERLICANCGCNSRQRFMIGKIFGGYMPGMKILMYESTSAVYQKLSREIPDITGFEYGGIGFTESEINGVHCEDICSLSHEDESFDLVVANDVFEHTLDYEKAFSEAYRVLKPGGKLIFTVPFDGNNVDTVRRAEQGECGLICTEEEWYHGSPVPDMPSLLVCQIFGWDMLEDLKKCGFADAYGKAYYILKEGYMGYLPLYFEAEKH